VPSQVGRVRWELIDRFDVLKKGRFARATMSFDGAEDFFAEHDPGRPRVPEPLYLEMIAQTGGVLLGQSLGFKKEVILAKIENAKFGAIVVPPCEFKVEADIEDEREEGAWVSGAVRHGAELVASARMFLVAIEALSPDKMVVFNERFMKHYDIDNIAKKSEGLRA
jgi:3-hydroxyacyl-[acyl-carrier-protein] dehydratase